MEIIFAYWWFWLAVAIITLIIEMIVPGFVIACFSIGATATAIASALGASLNVQLFVFAIVSITTLGLVRPLALKYFINKNKTTETNANALIGKTGLVTQRIDDIKQKGYVKIDGDEFPAKSFDNKAIEKGCEVEIVKIDSIVVIVRKIIN